MTLLRIALASLWNRRLAAGLSLATLALSVALLLAVERVRDQTRSSFASTISGTDLIVGARTGAVQLLLFSVFRIGEPSNTLSQATWQALAAEDAVAWTIPLSLGDAHRGFRVLGTNNDYFEHFRYGARKPLELIDGQRFDTDFDAVIGADVATALGLREGSEIEVAHGGGRAAISVHAEHPFRVVGVLARTGTPVDRTIHVPLAGIDAIHAEFQHAAAPTKPALTAIFVGLRNRSAALGLARQLNDYEPEALLAILPGLALTELWGIVGVAEKALLVIAGCVVLAGLFGMLTTLVTTLSERRREMAVLRAIGAQPSQVAALLVFESTLIATGAAALGLLLVTLAFALLAPMIGRGTGLYLQPMQASPYEAVLLASIILAGALAGLIPAFMAYRNTLADGLTVRT